MPDALKDSLYSPASLDAMAAVFQQVYPPFERSRFLEAVYDDAWNSRSVMERMRHIPQALRPLLPPDYRAALEVLKQAAPLLNSPFLAVALSEFVTLYGMDDWDASLPALAYLTQFGTSEFAVRPFIARDPARMMAQMLEWAGHDNEHVRRFASEGCRPRLPWGMALAAFKADPAPVVPVLERLRHDPSEYVRRSVANNLNDIAKDNPHVVIGVLRRWQTDPNENTHWIVTRALRTLVKAGHPEALGLLGFSDQAQVSVKALRLDRDALTLGESLTLSAEIESTSADAQNLVIDYVVYFRKATGKQTAKVFKLTTKCLSPGESLRIEKRVSFKPITTRVYYAGEHAIALQINGQETERVPFTLSLS